MVFPTAAREVREKWQLASASGYSHLICMPHVRREQIDELIAISGMQEVQAMKVLNIIQEDHPGLLAEVTTVLERKGLPCRISPGCRWVRRRLSA